MENSSLGISSEFVLPKQKEKEIPGFHLPFFITDHNADELHRENEESFRGICKMVKEQGIASMRYDLRWKLLEPEEGKWDEERLTSYMRARHIMREEGLEEPTVIFSSPPDWVVKLYKTDKQKFFDTWKTYVQKMKTAFDASSQPGENITRIQIMNELNNPVYNPFAIEDVGKMTAITREVFTDSPVEFSTTLLVHTLAGILPKLSQYENTLKTHFDSIGIDMYPGTYNYSLTHISQGITEQFKEIGLLKTVMGIIASWGKKYDIGEVGLPTTGKLWWHERGQRYFYNVFFQALKHALVDMRERGLQLPSRIGIYQAVDEPPKTKQAEMMAKMGWFEHFFGIQDKLITKAGKAGNPIEPSAKHPSRLKQIVMYMQAPMRRFPKEEREKRLQTLEVAKQKEELRKQGLLE